MDILSEMRPFFYPKAVAVVGVSRETWKFGSVAFSALRKFSSTLPIYPVNSRLTEFMGVPVFPSISSLPKEVDLVFLFLPAALVPASVRECADHGIPAVIIPGGGFREIGTEEGWCLEAELVSLAGSGVRLIGPNCFGVYSPAGGITILPGEAYPKKSGGVSFFAQSGGLTEDFCGLAEASGIYINHAVSFGNACDVNELTLCEYFRSDEKTKMVGGYLEGLKTGRRFFEAVREMAMTKPTVLWKAGLTPGGAKAAASHTGSLAGSDTAWRTFFKQTGAIQVFGMEDLLDTLSVFSHLPPTSNDQVAIICGGGGAGVAAGDACYRAGLTMASFDEKTRGKLRSTLAPTGASKNNPVDCDVPFPRPSVFRSVLEAVAESGCAGSIVIDKIALSVEQRRLLGCDKQVPWEDEPWLEEVPVRIRQEYGMTVLIVQRDWNPPLNREEYDAEKRRLRRYYQENGIPVLSSIASAMNGLGRMVQYYRRRGIS